VPATGNQPAIIHRFFPVIANKGNDCFINCTFQLLLPAFDSIEARRILGTAHKGMDPLQRLLADCFLALGKQSMAHSTLLWS
jgi:ubiquitin C-terminal hydrolase